MLNTIKLHGLTWQVDSSDSGTTYFCGIVGDNSYYIQYDEQNKLLYFNDACIPCNTINQAAAAVASLTSTTTHFELLEWRPIEEALKEDFEFFILWCENCYVDGFWYSIEEAWVTHGDYDDYVILDPQPTHFALIKGPNL